MAHAASRREVEEKARMIAGVLGGYARRHEIIYSKRILKKTGMRIG
jgi:hypothetical protein